MNPITSTSLSPAPIRTPIVNDDGMISTQWIKWLMIELYRRVGGESSLSNDDLEKLASAAQSQTSAVANALSASISALFNKIDHASPEISKLRADVNALRQTFQSQAYKPEIPPAHPRSPIDPTAVHKKGVEAISGRKRFDVPFDLAQPSIGGTGDRQWSLTVNQTTAGTVAFYFSNSITATPDTTGTPPLEIGIDYLKLSEDTNVKFTRTKIGIDDTGELGFWGVTPVTQPTPLTADLPDVTVTSTNTTPWGYSTQAQADSIVTLLNNLNMRVYELETKLTSLGLLGV